jgi:hypothetical protein
MYSAVVVVVNFEVAGLAQRSNVGIKNGFWALSNVRILLVFKFLHINQGYIFKINVLQKPWP